MAKRYIPGHLNRRAKKNSAGAAAVTLAAGIALLAVLIGATFGKYLHQLRSEGSVRAQEFYFTSDFLDGGTHTLAPGSTAMSFTLGNYADELRFSEMDITYEVTVTPVDDATTPNVQYVNTEKKLSKGVRQDNTVTITGLTSGKTYTITATGRGGYEQSLTATVVVLAQEPVVYKYLDTTNSEYVLLTVWAQGYQGDVTIAPPAGLIPDNTDLVMALVKTGDASFTDTTSFKDNDYCSHTYRFFGSGVTADHFTVTYGDSKTAEVEAPR